ncbi:Fe-S cluster assembly protein NifU [Vibrio algarum]|uniref:Nitrogen fixation protein NifU n=1 Tax=Vibrio algarum TaxID=3020714 RepID=A0ABT4YRJ0_9VIBR|nr:Fe-S cluster assembly protein NifU [Vibrio sp. KJ40-1]MDB1124156.1 Fe-S cluster assembly protein NifU [Vibrio sp. KJ40-1]
MWNYSEKMKEHFFQPRNAKLLSDGNAKGDVGSLSCGDALSLRLKVNEDSEVIEDAGFQTFGCGSAIASSSALTEIIIGKTLDEALKVTNKEIAEYLDGLPPEKMHCSVMGMEALHAAVADYRGEQLDDDHEEGELICKCFAIDDLMIKRVVEANQLSTLEEVINYTKAGGACESCHEKIEWVLEECLQTSASDVVADLIPPKPKERRIETLEPVMSQKDLIKRIRVVESVIEEMRPAIVADGGNIELVDIEDDLVFVSLTGSCTSCSLSGLTLASIETKVSEALGISVTVFPVQESNLKEATYDA